MRWAGLRVCAVVAALGGASALAPRPQEVGRRPLRTRTRTRRGFEPTTTTTTKDLLAAGFFRSVVTTVATMLVVAGPASAATNLVTETADLLDKYYYDVTALAAPGWKEARARLEGEAEKEGSRAAALRAEALKALKADRYTRILDPRTYREVARFDVLGVGLILSPGEDGVARVVSPPLPGSAAAASKQVRQGDVVVAINGRETRGLSSFELLDVVNDSKDQRHVDFLLRRDGDPSERALTLTRDVGNNNNNNNNKKDDGDGTISRAFCTTDGVGFAKIDEFSAKVGADLARVLGRLDADGCGGRIILDVRGNPGGAFQSAISAASLFLPKDAPVVTVVEKARLGDANQAEQQETFRAKAAPDLFDNDRRQRQPPLLRKVEVWVDGGSASSSEIFAGALRDNCAAVLAGNSKTFGKGLIQAVFGLADDSGLVVTVAQYRTPNGDSIQGLGIQPDVPLPTSPIPFGPVPVPSKADFDAAYDTGRKKALCPTEAATPF